jgi:hypothetical protein
LSKKQLKYQLEHIRLLLFLNYPDHNLLTSALSLFRKPDLEVVATR